MDPQHRLTLEVVYEAMESGKCKSNTLEERLRLTRLQLVLPCQTLEARIHLFMQGVC